MGVVDFVVFPLCGLVCVITLFAESRRHSANARTRRERALLISVLDGWLVTCAFSHPVGPNRPLIVLACILNGALLLTLVQSSTGFTLVGRWGARSYDGRLGNEHRSDYDGYRGD